VLDNTLAFYRLRAGVSGWVISDGITGGGGNLKVTADIATPVRLVVTDSVSTAVFGAAFEVVANE
jgi:hypothetical protein